MGIQPSRENLNGGIKTREIVEGRVEGKGREGRKDGIGPSRSRMKQELGLADIE